MFVSHFMEITVVTTKHNVNLEEVSHRNVGQTSEKDFKKNRHENPVKCGSADIISYPKELAIRWHQLSFELHQRNLLVGASDKKTTFWRLSFCHVCCRGDMHACVS